MNTKHSTQMDFNNVVQMLAKKFGTAQVSTQEMIQFIASMGQNPQRYYDAIRAQYKVAHGKMQFVRDGASTFEMPVREEEPVVVETQYAIEKRINARFNALSVMATATAKGINRALIVSGPAGLGKSFGVEQAAMEHAADFVHIKGFIRPTGLYKTLYANRSKKSLIVFDDADSLFSDETCLNLLKAACDSSDVRKLSWLSNTPMEDEDGEHIPSTFVFEGSVIFITNIDFQQQVDRGTRLAPHFEALMSRSHFLDLGIKKKTDYVVRIKQVLRAGMLDDVITQDEKTEIVAFIEDNIDRMRELSLRMVKKLADLMLMDRDNWKELASMTCMKNV